MVVMVLWNFLSQNKITTLYTITAFLSIPVSGN
jgi:hypothetical protein